MLRVITSHPSASLTSCNRGWPETYPAGCLRLDYSICGPFFDDLHSTVHRAKQFRAELNPLKEGHLIRGGYGVQVQVPDCVKRPVEPEETVVVDCSPVSQQLLRDLLHSPEGASRYDVHKYFGFFVPIVAFGTDLYYIIDATSLPMSAFP